MCGMLIIIIYVHVYQFKHLHNITWQKVDEIVPLSSSTQDMKERWKDSLHPINLVTGRTQGHSLHQMQRS